MKNLLIPKIVDIILQECKVGYCGSCMAGCHGMTKFICLGLTIKDIDEWIESHPDLYAEMCDGLFDDTPFPSGSSLYSCMFTEDDVKDFTSEELDMLNRYIVGINEQLTQSTLGIRKLSIDVLKERLNQIKLDSELYQLLDSTKRAKVFNNVNSWFKKRVESILNTCNQCKS